MPHLRDQLQSSLSGAYTLDRELGGGGMSRVFVAEETRLGRKVVVKVLSPELAAALSNERFEREIKLAASLQQANIVPVLTAGETGGLPYYTMPFVEGESLRARLARDGTALPIGEVLGILKDVGRALAYAHQHGVVHRDIKPDNVLLSGGAAVVTDFGIAKAIAAARTSGGSTLTQVGTSVGTPAYMAPEQAAGDDVDHRADIYSLGCLAYELLTGHVPFHGRSPQRMVAAHMSEHPQPVQELRSDCPAELASLVMRCLEKDPARRPQNASEVVQDVDSIATSGTGGSASGVLLQRRVSLPQALAYWAVAATTIPLVAKAAVIAIGLPDWVFPGSIGVVMLGLPVILLTHFVQRTARRAFTTPSLTPGGSPAHGTLAAVAMKASPHMTWKRAALGGAWSLGVFAAGVAAFMLLRAMGIGPAGSLFASGTLQAREPLLVSDFKINGPDTALGPVLAEAVRTNLRQSTAMDVVPASVIGDILRRMRQPENIPLDVELAKEMAQREGIRGVVAGDATPLGGGYVLTLRLLGGSSGDELASVRGVADSPEELLGGIDAVTRKLRGRIGESLRAVRQSPALERVTTTSLEALRLYSDGNRLANRNEHAKAIPPLEEAIRLDSNFAMAYRRLGIAVYNAGGNIRRGDSLLTRAYQLRDRLDERERLHVEAVYYAFVVSDRARAVHSYERILSRWPNDLTATHNLALSLRSRQEFVRAESLYLSIVGKGSGPGGSTLQLIETQVDLGRFAEARRSAAKWGRGHPSVPLRYASIAYNDGQLDSAVFYVKEFRKGVTDPQQQYSALSALSSIAAVRGRFTESSRLLAEGRAILSAPAVASSTALTDSLNAAEREGWLLDRPAEGVRRVDAAVARFQPLLRPARERPYRRLAQLYAMFGRPDRARALIAQRDAVISDSASRRAFDGARRDLFSWIAIAEKRPLDAVREFRAMDRMPDGPANACSMCSSHAIAFAFERAGMVDSVIVWYEHYVNTPFATRWATDGWHVAHALKRLGELDEAKGERQKALGYYLRFAELWKSADPEFQPRVKEVRAKIERLRDTERR